MLWAWPFNYINASLILKECHADFFNYFKEEGIKPKEITRIKQK
jgi:hypothetical protein